MNEEQLVYLYLPTKFGINIYSAKVIDQYNFYIETLKIADISIELKYNNNDSETFHINDILNLLEIENNQDNTYHFTEVYKTDFNSNDRFRIFDMIEKAYKNKYNTEIKNGGLFSKYNELFRKIKTIEKHTQLIYQTLDMESKKIIQDKGYHKYLKNCLDKLSDPITNEKEIIDKLEEMISVYRRLQFEENQNKKEKDKQFNDQKAKNDITIKKNKFGQFVYEKYNLVLDPSDKTIIGTANGMGGYYPLNCPNVELCKQLKLQYKCI